MTDVTSTNHDQFFRHIGERKRCGAVADSIVVFLDTLGIFAGTLPGQSKDSLGFDQHGLIVRFIHRSYQRPNWTSRNLAAAPISLDVLSF